jgi:hypothetical protein
VVLEISDRGMLEILKPDLAGINSLEINLSERESKALNEIHPNTFNNLTSTQKLLFKANKSTIIGLGNTFVLKSNVNMIQSVNRLTNLKILSLKNCTIDDISENFYLGSPFVHLSNLTELDLSSNKIKQINKTCFKGIFKIIFLDMSDNIISDIKDFPFDYLESLESLNLSNNPINTLYWNSFGTSLKNLIKLDISNCPLEFTTRLSIRFKHLVKLDEIHLPEDFEYNSKDKFVGYGLKKECNPLFYFSLPFYLSFFFLSFFFFFLLFRFFFFVIGNNKKPPIMETGHARCPNCRSMFFRVLV